MNAFDDRPPPDSLGRHVLRSVRRRGIVRERPALRLVRLVGTVLGAAVLFAGGFLAGRRPTAAAGTNGNRYALLFYEDTSFIRATGGSHAPEYAAWADSLSASGAVELGGELLPREITIAAAGAAPEQDGPARDSLGRWIGGFLVIRASNSAEALRIARSSPHLRYGGTIGVRAVAGVESGGRR